jgi:hypothetical protein
MVHAGEYSERRRILLGPMVTSGLPTNRSLPVCLRTAEAEFSSG